MSGFLQQKYSVFQRLRPNDQKQTKLVIKLNQILPGLRKFLRPAELQTFSTVLIIAVELEQDDTAEAEAMCESDGRPVQKKHEQLQSSRVRSAELIHALSGPENIETAKMIIDSVRPCSAKQHRGSGYNKDTLELPSLFGLFCQLWLTRKIGIFAAKFWE